MTYTRVELHQKILSNKEAICEWFKEKSKGLSIPIYSSYDIRDSGYKVSNVDANIYPAGFNNICPIDKESSVEIFDKYFKANYSTPLKRIILVTEEHTNNPYYWDNVATIKNLIEQTGRELRVAFAQRLEKPLLMKSYSGHEITVESAWPDSQLIHEFKPELIISNNDFSDPHSEWNPPSHIPVNPPRELGWYQRKKSTYFKFYNELVEEFSKKATLDPFTLQVKTELFEHFDINLDSSRKHLADQVSSMIDALKIEYKNRGIQQEPFVFVKNNAGTYGLAVIRVKDPKEIIDWTYKARKKMKAAKGGREVQEVIIQEGIPSIIERDGVTAEPVVYMIGTELAGGFLRTHSEKDATESLNSPGAIYKRLCVSDLEIKPEGCPLENVYGWTSKLGALAIGMEAALVKN